MRYQRGVTEGTLGMYLPLVQELLAELGDETRPYDASQVRTFILAVSRRHGQSRTMKRAGINAPSTGAHVRRHSAATAMRRQGISLDIVGAILRHRCRERTAHSANVDTVMLRAIPQPWPLEGELLG
jgi:hypothetical protein